MVEKKKIYRTKRSVAIMEAVKGMTAVFEEQARWGPEVPRMVYYMLKNGMTLAGIAETLGVHTRTLMKWVEGKPEMAVAIREGREAECARIKKTMFEKCVGYKRKKTIYAQYKGEFTEEKEIEETVEGDGWLCLSVLKALQPEEYGVKQEMGNEKKNRGIREYDITDYTEVTDEELKRLKEIAAKGLNENNK